MAKEFLGVGWAFPLRIDADGSFARSEHDEDIREAIRIILSTVPGERVMRPEFGCGIHEYVFAVLNAANLALMEREVEKALTLFEPRIEVVSVTAAPDSDAVGKVVIDIAYRVVSTNSRRNMVYPFYLAEKE